MHLNPSSMGAAASRSHDTAWWHKCRADTPGCKRVIHFNSAGAHLASGNPVQCCTIGQHLQQRITQHWLSNASPLAALFPHQTAPCRCFTSRAVIVLLSSSHLCVQTAGAALQPQCVLDAVQRYQQEEATWGGYETQRRFGALAQPPALSGVVVYDPINCCSSHLRFSDSKP
jgi:hypothetical protein